MGNDESDTGREGDADPKRSTSLTNAKKSSETRFARKHAESPADSSQASGKGDDSRAVGDGDELVEDPGRSGSSAEAEDAAPAAGSAKEGATERKRFMANDLQSIPNGGLQAWLQAAGSFCLFFNTWGLINTFGVYQTFYERDLLRDSSSSSISWIGSIQACLLLLIGSLTGPIYDAGYFHTLLLTGTFLLVFGVMMLSICEEYWQVLLAQGFCVGLGAGCLFVPSVAILSTYFTTRLATATGVAAVGSSIGGVVYPIIFHQLEPRIGFGWSTRVVGFLVLGTLALPNAVMRMRIVPPARRKMVDGAAFREAPYALFVSGAFLGFMGLYPPFFFVQLYCLEKGIAGAGLAFYLLSILNAGSVFGRLLPNMLADRTGPLNIIVPCAMVTGLLSLCLIPVVDLAGIVVFCLLYGFFSGTFVSLPPTVIVSLTKDRRYIGTRLGMCFTITSIGLLIGGPIAGAIVDRGFTPVWIFGGVSTIAGASIMLMARFAKVGFKLKVRA